MTVVSAFTPPFSSRVVCGVGSIFHQGRQRQRQRHRHCPLDSTANRTTPRCTAVVILRAGPGKGIKEEQEDGSPSSSSALKSNPNDEQSQDLRRALGTSLSVVFNNDDEDHDDNDESSRIAVGDTVVVANDFGNLPELGLWQSQSYTVQNIFDVIANSETNLVERVNVPTLNASTTVNPATASLSSGSHQKTTIQRYIVLYSPKYHTANDGVGVTVAVDEIRLVSMRTEVMDSMLWALPLFGFWTALAFSFALRYQSKYGGTLLDAFFGR